MTSMSETQADRYLQSTLHTAFAEIDHLQAEWDELVSRHTGGIYMTYDWLKTWWQFYGEGRQLRVFIFSHDNKLVALLPFYLETFGAGPLKTTVARLVGANIPPKTFDPPVDPAFAEEIFTQVLKRLFAHDRCHLLALGPVSDTWAPSVAFRKACADARELVSPPAYERRDVQTVFHLPPAFDQYVASLSSTERKNRMKRVRHLERDHRVSCDVISDPALVEREFSAFALQHARQWKTVGKAGHFGAWPRGEAYNRALVKAQAKHGRVCFFRMLVDDQVVSSRYTFILGGTVYSELPAREVGEPWDRLGVGGISLVKFIESAIREELTVIDSGLGTYEHKAQLGGDQIPVGTWYVQAHGTGHLKARIFRTVAKVILLACRKLWYSRILPRLPRQFERTQARWWLRFDV
jgi:CelD/BcsL family acetyltransferase involved in cellulose biosynthesis